MSDDERKGKMSASKLGSYQLCPGKWQAEKGLPNPESEAARNGTLFHKAMAGEIPVEKLSEDLRELFTLCWDQYSEIAHNTGFLAQPVDKVMVEQRLWCKSAGPEREWSGGIDRIEIIGDTALITDWKSGRIAQGTASSSVQLRAYAVLAKENHPTLQKIYVSLIQPLAGAPTVAGYDAFDLDAAREQVDEIIDDAMKPGAQRVPSADACRYCAAKGICPEARAEAEAVVAVEPPALVGLSDEQLGLFLDRAEVAEDVIAEAKAEAKRRLLAGQKIPGLALQKGRASRSIRDAQEAFQRLYGSLSPEQFVSACKVSVTQLESELCGALYLKKKEAKEKLSELLGEVLETKIGEPVMVRKQAETKGEIE